MEPVGALPPPQEEIFPKAGWGGPSDVRTLNREASGKEQDKEIKTGKEAARMRD